MYDSINTFKDVVDSKVLPKEYGGTMPMAEMIGKLHFINHK